MWRSSRSRTERVASANDRYVVAVAAAAALMALASTRAIVGPGCAPSIANPSVSIARMATVRSGRRPDEVAGILPTSMRLATFIAPGGDQPQAGEVRGDEIVAFAAGTVRDRLASGDLTPAGGPSYALADVTLLEPVPYPRAIFGIGRNYAAHAAELGNVLPDAPIVFMKLPPSSVPGGGPVVRPAVSQQLDYRSEERRVGK